MNISINSQDIKDIFTEIRDEMIRNREYLCELDGVMGDGDLGITMSEGYSKIVEAIDSSSDSKAGKLVINAGTVMAGAVPSTMGTLMATAIMRAGKEVKDSEVINTDDFVKMGQSAIEGIKQRGKAAKGEKTILDSLIPAVEAIENSISEGGNIKEIISIAYSAALKGVESTKEMKSVHGRASWYGEQSIGKQDPGATACMLVFKGMLNWVEKKKPV
jgi:phosphoenolpyruvate---glycerone phosphotransferase subunit DhaL